MIDVGRDDGAATRDFAAHELRRHERRDGSAEALPVGEARFRLLVCPRAPDILAVRDVDHLLGDDPGAGELELGHRTFAPRCDPAGTQRRQSSPHID